MCGECLLASARLGSEHIVFPAVLIRNGLLDADIKYHVFINEDVEPTRCYLVLSLHF
jgi:hypothetical protein